MITGFVRGWLESDLEWIFKDDASKRPPSGTCYFPATPDEAQKACEVLRTAGDFTFDLEFFGRPFNSDFQILDAACTPHGSTESYNWDKDALADPSIRGPLLQLLADESIRKRGQNVKGDCVAIKAAYGVDVSSIWMDTKLVRRIMQADSSASLHDLQALIGMAGSKDNIASHVDLGVKTLKLAAKPFSDFDTHAALFDVPPKDFDSAVDRLCVAKEVADAQKPPYKSYAYAAIPREPRGLYCGADAYTTDSVSIHLEAQMSDAARDVWNTVGREFNYGITRMQTNGIAVCPEAAKRVGYMMSLEMEQHAAILKDYPGLNVNSNKQVAQLLFDDLGFKSTKKTKGGDRSVDNEVLAKIDHPVANAITGYKQAKKFREQYADGLISRFMTDDQRVHPDFNVDGTETGRPSCSNPALLTIPGKKTAQGKACRNIYVAPKGYRLVGLDYSQVELRVAAFLSGDAKMIDFFKSGADFHLETAKLAAPLFGYDPAEIDADHVMRSHAKAVNFGAIFGESAESQARKRGITVKLAEQLQAAIFGEFVDLTAWSKESLKFARKHGFCRTWWDGRDFRIRPLYNIASSVKSSRETAERSSWNTRIQGTAADFTNASVGAIQRFLDRSKIDARLVLTVYDAIFLEVAEADAMDMIHAARGIMEGWNIGDVPLIADAQQGYDWGHLENVPR